MSYIYKNLGNLREKTQVILVPSHNDITHMYPLPQPPFDAKSFDTRKLGAAPHLVGNPSIFMLNDISIGFLNADVVKDMCLNVCNKFEVPESQKTDEALASLAGTPRPSDAAKPKPPPKIDQVLYGLLQQRSLYPLYPPGQNTPIEVEQVQQFMFEKTPDVIITPSDLMLFAKNISGCICINPGFMCKGSTGGSYASITIDPLVIASRGMDLNGSLQNQKMSNRASDRIRVDIQNI